MSYGKVFSSAFLLFALAFNSFSQSAHSSKTVKGRVVDQENRLPLEFATVALFSANDSSLIQGTITDVQGNFEIKVDTDDFYAKIDYVSYESLILNDIETSGKVVDLGDLALAVSDKVLAEIEVTGERMQMELRMDKKVFNVSDDISSTGGSASDLLNNVPSINVDAEGNVSLRGSGSVRILIDGKQSGLVGISASDALQQLPANLIERVEVITNPSSRYEASGTGGIINIILKKNKEKGYSGFIDLSVGHPENYNGTFSFNYRKNKLNLFGSYGFRYGKRLGSSYTYRETYEFDADGFLMEDSTTILDQRQEFDRTGISNTINLGLDYSLNSYNTFTFSGVYRKGSDESVSIINNLEKEAWSDFSEGSARHFTEEEEEPNYDFNARYERTFDTENKSLAIDYHYGYSSEEETGDVFEEFFDGDEEASKEDLFQHTLNEESQRINEIKLDYVQPLWGKGQLEAGLKIDDRSLSNNYTVSELQNGAWNVLDSVSNKFLYADNIYAGYVSVGNEYGKFSYMAGLRAEYTTVNTELKETGETSDKDYLNLFPTVHLSYKTTSENAVQISYSRRIRRPNFWQLNPFLSYVNDKQVRQGNPNLDPELTHSTEVSYIKNWPAWTLSSSVFYRHTDGEFEYITYINEEGVNISRPENLSTEDAYGLEFIFQGEVTDWWRLMANANFYRSITDGGNLNENFTSDNFAWSSRLSSSMAIPKVADFQAMFNYRAPTTTPQGERNSFYSLDLTLAKDILKNKGTISFNVRDVFNSRRFKGTVVGENYYLERDFQWSQRTFLIGFNYRINQNKQRSRNPAGGNGGMEEGAGF